MCRCDYMRRSIASDLKIQKIPMHILQQNHETFTLKLTHALEQMKVLPSDR